MHVSYTLDKCKSHNGTVDVGEKYYDGCNWCTCGKNGAPTVCTKRGCLGISSLLAYGIYLLDHYSQEQVNNSKKNYSAKPKLFLDL